ncbi:MAG TPA: TIGR02679 family protein [Actinomycetota bacterium]|nr:TIGR02679 family protein [Actinomycetota bacterium]
MKPVATAEVIELLSAPELHRLFVGARRRLEQSASLSASFALVDPDDAERRAVGRLFGTRPPTGRAVRISLERLDAALTNSRFGVGLVEALELAGGPIPDLRAARLAAAEKKEALWRDLAGHPAVVARPELSGWLEGLRSSGLASRLATGQESQLIATALGIIESLPRSGDRLNVVAAKAMGNAHALDRGTSLGALVVNALAHLSGVRTPSTAADRRTLWASFGVVCDELSCDVLTLGLEPVSQSASSPLNAMRANGQPMRLTLRHVATDRMTFKPSTVFVCENPVVVAEAADFLGSSAPPIVCTEGIPNTAALLLLTQMSSSDCRFTFHGDFDWGGVKIFNHLRRSLHELIAPWRFGRDDYLQALDRLGAISKLESIPADTEWDPSLRETMINRGLAVFEEQVLDDLIRDLQSTAEQRQHPPPD